MSASIQSPSPAAPPGIVARALAGPVVKLALIGVLLLIMLIPEMWVSSMIDERQDRQQQVQEEIGRSWGPEQSVLGPILVVPFRATRAQPNLSNGQPQPPVWVRGYLHVMPARLVARVRLAPEMRRRGLFRAIVYSADVSLGGSFTVPPLAVREHPEAELLWRESYLAIGASDLRAFAADTPLSWSGQSLPAADDPPEGADCGMMRFMRWNLALTAAPAPDRAIAFETAFKLRGTQVFRLVPAARQIEMTAEAPWATPSFTGAVLPASSNVTGRGFEAQWAGAGGARQLAWHAPVAMQCNGSAIASANNPDQQIGVALLEAVPTYRMVTRASKYTVLFLALAYLTYFLFETLTRSRIHFVQYGLMGLSLSMFALLLLSLAEPIGFPLAYVAASAAIVLQASLYTAAATRRISLAVTFAGVIAALFGFLYVVLSLETYSLLAGAVALFVVLSVVMAATSHVDWSKPRT